jgi:pilus assembly protein CpaE
MQRDPIATSLVVNLKVAAVSPQRATLQHLGEVLQTWDGAAPPILVCADPQQALHTAEDERPDVLLVEGVSHDREELMMLEHLTHRHPAMAVILLSPSQSADFLRQAMRIGLREVLPLPVPREALLETISRVQRRAAAAAAPRRRGKVLSFIGCKGGSGATFLATNLAYALADARPGKVALIDLNRQFGDAALYITHQSARCTLADLAQQVHRLDAALLASSMMEVLPNLHLLPAAEDPEQALQLRPESIQPLLWMAASHYDVVIVDAGRSLDDVSVRALDQSEAIFAVLQLNLPFLRDAKRMLASLAALGYGKEKVQLIVNRHQKGEAITLEDATTSLRYPVFKTIPNSFGAVADSVNQGTPIVKLAPRDPVARALRDMADTIMPAKKESGGWLRSLLPGR